jgi:hypothetical protein
MVGARHGGAAGCGCATALKFYTPGQIFRYDRGCSVEVATLTIMGGPTLIAKIIKATAFDSRGAEWYTARLQR